MARAVVTRTETAMNNSTWIEARSFARPAFVIPAQMWSETEPVPGRDREECHAGQE